MYPGKPFDDSSVGLAPAVSAIDAADRPPSSPLPTGVASGFLRVGRFRRSPRGFCDDCAEAEALSRVVANVDIVVDTEGDWDGDAPSSSFGFPAPCTGVEHVTPDE